MVPVFVRGTLAVELSCQRIGVERYALMVFEHADEAGCCMKDTYAF